VSCGVVGNDKVVYSHGLLVPPPRKVLAADELSGAIPLRRQLPSS